ncbi:MAG: hypothetical protein MUP02_00050 [Actinobacteria bacterium]|nr:hypothetical protein [Actinomycetota bacterium]
MSIQKKILIIYHSGSGSTRTVSEILKDRLSSHCEVDLLKICPDFDYGKRNCWSEGKDFPLINTGKCEFCLKCVHNCPGKAIIFTEKMKDSPRLDKIFYNKLKRDTFL